MQTVSQGKKPAAMAAEANQDEARVRGRALKLISCWVQTVLLAGLWSAAPLPAQAVRGAQGSTVSDFRQRLFRSGQH